jgi:phage-related protein
MLEEDQAALLDYLSTLVAREYVVYNDPRMRVPLWEIRSMWKHSIVRSLFFDAGDRLLVVTHIFQKKSGSIPKSSLQRGLERMERWRRERMK